MRRFDHAVLGDEVMRNELGGAGQVARTGKTKNIVIGKPGDNK
jgi:hypothetical protein